MRRTLGGSIAASALALVLAACGKSHHEAPAPRPSAAYATKTVPPGSPQCAYGGVQVDMGIDDDGNGALDAAEVDATEYVCNGAPGAAGSTGAAGASGAAALVSVTPEAAGAHCLAGGLRVQSGPDANGDAALDAAEITTTAYVCNGTSGVANASRVRTTPVAAGSTCAAGGYRLESGIDDDGNGVLDDDEVDASTVVCSGASGTLVRVVAEPPGSRCAAGGLVIQSGVDDDHDGTLSLAEVDASEYVCNGLPSEPRAIDPLPLVVANDYAVFTGTLDTSDLRLADGTRADFYAFTMAQAGTLDLSSIPAGAVEFHVFTQACLPSGGLDEWTACFVGRAAPKLRLDAGPYVLLVKGTESAYLWGATPYEAVLRRLARGDVGAATIAEHVAAGRTALQAALATHATDDFLRAVEHHASAAALIGHDATATAADLDRARFFGGLAKVAILAQPYSDLVPGNGLHDLGDLLDGFGLGGTPFQRSNADTLEMSTCTTQQQCGPYGCWSSTSCETKPLAPDSPRGQELQAFLRDQVATGLEGAVALLDAVTPSFAAEVTDHGRAVQLDATDALFLKAAAHGMLASIRIQQAYDLDADLDEVQTNADARDARGDAVYGPKEFLAEYPFFLRLRSAATLPVARAEAVAAVDAFRAAIASLRAETDDQADDLVTISDETCTWNGMSVQCTTQYNPAAKLDELDSNLADVRGALVATGPYTFTNGTTDPADDVTIDASRFFAGVDLRAMIPRLDAGPNHDRPGMLPDVTFGGVLVSSPAHLTEDLDGDGSPDILNDTYSYFFESYLAGHTLSFPYFQRCVYDPYSGSVCQSMYGPIALDPSGSFVLSNPADATAYPGTWTWTAESLTLTFTGAPAGVKTVAVTNPRDIARGQFFADTQFRDAGGAILGWYGTWWGRTQ